MRIVRFRERIAIPRYFKVGVDMDNGVELIKFVLPEIAEGQVALLAWKNGEHADEVQLTDSGIWVVENTMTQYPGEAECYVTVAQGTDLLWRSEVFIVRVMDIPDVSGTVTQTWPTAIVQAAQAAADATAAAAEARSAIAQGVEDAQAAAEAAAASAQSAAEDAEAAESQAGLALLHAERAEDAAEEVEALVGDLSKADIMRQQKLLRYEDHGGDWINQPGTARPTYQKTGPMLRINGAVTATSGYTYGISKNEMVEGESQSIINPGIRLLAGHVYAAKVRFLDGTFTSGSATAYWHEARLYTWDGTTLGNTLVGHWRVNQGETVNAAGLGVMSAVITPAVDMTAGFAWYDRGAGEYVNFRFVVDLEDVTYIQDILHDILNAQVTVSGTTPTIAAKSGVRYICGEVATIKITPPASGICDVIFVSGSTPAVLTATGVTWPAWFDPDVLDANCTYELNIMDGRGTVGVWS